MTSYHYQARTLEGQVASGTLEAESPAEAARQLEHQRLFPVKIEEVAASPTASVLGPRVRTAELAALYSQLSDLLGAGVPLLRALNTILRLRGERPHPLTSALREVRDAVMAGSPLHEAMAKRPTLFLPLHQAMIQAAERGGFMEQALGSLATFLERQDELASRVRGAMIYPALLSFVGISVMLGALVFMVPQFRPMFEGVPLPLPTVVLFSISRVLESYGLVVVVVLAALLLWAGASLQSESGKAMLERWWLALPGLGRMLRLLAITRFCRILGAMLTNGVAILPALTIARDAVGSVAVARSVDQAIESVRAGQPLAQPLREAALFPPEIVEMIAVAEESNQLEKVLLQIADTVERRANRAVDSAVRLIEPAILTLIAGGIGFMAVGLLFPVFTMARAMR